MKPTSRAWLTLIMMSVLMVLSLMDRQILAMLVEPLKTQFKISDVQIGFLLGTAFAVTYGLLGVPAGRYADRGSRKLLVITGVTLWCLCTIASGFATSFLVLVIFRIGLAAGEAVLTPAAHSMIGDLFPPERRSFAASIFISAAFVGGPLAYSGGALIITFIDGHIASYGLNIQTWQAVLIAVGAPGLLICLLFALVVKEPTRVSIGETSFRTSTRDVIRQLQSRKKLYTGLFLGATLGSACSTSVIIWGIELLRRDFAWTAEQAGTAFGPVLLLAGLTGSLLPPLIVGQLKLRGRSDAVVLVSMGCSLLSLLGLGLGVTAADPFLRLLLVYFGVAGALGAFTNIASAMQEFAPGNMRGTFIGVLYLLMNLVGYGATPVVVPAVADLLGSSSDNLGEGLATVCIVLSIIGFLLFAWVRKAYQGEARAGFPTVAISDV